MRLLGIAIVTFLLMFILSACSKGSSGNTPGTLNTGQLSDTSLNALATLMLNADENAEPVSIDTIQLNASDSSEPINLDILFPGKS